MFKLGIGIFCLIMALIFGNAMVVSGESEDEDMSVPMGIIPLEPPESVEVKRSSVEFPHSTHFGFMCQTCHHTWETDAPVVKCMASGCHDGVVSPTKAEKGDDVEALTVSYYKSAYHQMCITCHKEMKAQNKKLELSGRVLFENLPNTGPTGCKDCHVPEE
jgi:hypothetical protein